MVTTPAGRVDRLVDGYLDHLRVERGVSPHTAQAYRRDLRRYAQFLAERGIQDAAAVDRQTVSDFAADLRDPRGDRAPLAASSAARTVVAVRSMHRFAVEEGILTDDPAAGVPPPKAGTRLPKALSVDQVQRLLDVPDPTTVTGVRDAALLELLYGTGARISELVSLDVDDVARWALADHGPDHRADQGETVDDHAGLRLFGKGSKERVVPLGSYARRALSVYLVRARPELVQAGRGTPALFLNTRGARLSRQSAYNILRDTAGRAEITTAVSPHTLRHSFATHLLDGGADVRVVQELLGHASVTTTQIYTLVTLDHLREVYLSSHPRAR